MNENETRQETATSPAAAETETETAPARDAAEQSHGTAVYVRRGRTPNLAFWVVLLVLIAFFGGALTAVVLGALSLAAIFNAAMLAAMVIGVPLAAIAVLVDAVRTRRRR